MSERDDEAHSFSKSLDSLQDRRRIGDSVDDSSFHSIADNEASEAYRKHVKEAEWTEACDEYAGEIMRSGGDVDEALAQTNEFIGWAERDPVGASQNLAQWYKMLPPSGLHQPKPTPPAPDADHYAWTKFALEEVKWRDAERESKARAAERLKQFREQHGDSATGMVKSISNLHRQMSKAPDETAMRLPLSIIGHQAQRQIDTAGLNNAGREIAAFLQRNPRLNTPELRNRATRELTSGRARTLEQAFSNVLGLGRHNVGGEAHQKSVNFDTQAALEAHKALMSPAEWAQYQKQQAVHRRASKW
jgi:hypothetical protein